MTDLQKAAQRVIKAMGEGQATLTLLGVELLTLQKENARLREALAELTSHLDTYHDATEKKAWVRALLDYHLPEARAALSGDERDQAAENRAAIAEQEHGWREA